MQEKDRVELLLKAAELLWRVGAEREEVMKAIRAAVAAVESPREGREDEEGCQTQGGNSSLRVLELKQLQEDKRPLSSLRVCDLVSLLLVIQDEYLLDPSDFVRE